MTLLRGISFIVLLFGVTSAMHAEVYKWTDKNGDVHYTQTPPPSSQDVQATLRSNNRFGVSSIKPLQGGDKIFCGTLAVMDTNKDDAVLEENIRVSLDAWVTERNSLDKRRLNLPISTPAPLRRKLDSQYAEFDCRVKWAHGHLKVLNSFERKSDIRYSDLRSEYDRLKSRQEEECSTDPKKLGKTMLIGKEANDWGKCYDKYKYRMRDVKAQMKENRRSLRESYE